MEAASTCPDKRKQVTAPTTPPFLLSPQVFIGLSCMLAVLCNLSQYLCIGKFSAVTFQVLGHMKTVLVLILGYVLFTAPVSLKNMAGMGVAVVGMVLYSWAVEKGKKEREEASKSKSKLLERKERERERRGESKDGVLGGEEEKVGLLDKEQSHKAVDKV